MKVQRIKEYVKKAHEIATAHGFHDEKKTDGHWLCLVISELMEAVEADRRDNRADMMGFIERVAVHPDFSERYEAYIKGSVEEELTDAAIRIFDFIGEKFPDLRLGEGFDPIPEEGKMFTEKAYYLIYGILGPDRIQLIDSINYIEAWARQIGFDLEWHIRQKMEYNAQRQRLHGKKY